MNTQEKIDKMIEASGKLAEAVALLVDVVNDKTRHPLQAQAKKYVDKFRRLLENDDDGLRKFLWEATEQAVQEENGGVTYQILAYDEYGKLVHAGPRKLNELSLDVLRKEQRDWEQWRENYVKTHPGNYPLKDDHREVKFVVVYPLENHLAKQTFLLQEEK